MRTGATKLLLQAIRDRDMPIRQSWFSRPAQ